jgi:two-component system, chemotaxis family, chemotaxis protein CheY
VGTHNRARAAAQLKLLIVDDSNVVRRRIERSTHIERLRVVGTAANGVQAVRMFEELAPDVVTMDITMPEMDGVECIEQLVARDPQVLILVISALADKFTAIEAVKRGANGFLYKPFTDKQLNDALTELLRGAA